MTRYPFFTSCLPWFVLHRVNEYCYGPILAGLAFERYLLVLRAAEAKTYLSEINRKRAYVIVTSFIASCVIGDGIGRYLMGYQKWLCTFAYSKSAWDGILSAILFYFFPAIITTISYIKISKTIMGRKFDTERNLELTISFSAICLVWVVNWGAKYMLQQWASLVDQGRLSFKILQESCKILLKRMHLFKRSCKILARFLQDLAR